MRLGLRTKHAYIAAYCARTGRDGIPDWDFYLAFNFFRLAAIFRRGNCRVLHSTASTAQARERAGALSRLTALAHEVKEKCR